MAFLRALFPALFRDITHHGLNLHAMGLVYTSLLSLVPLLALTFSVLKGFGIHQQLEAAVLRLLAPLGSNAEVINQQIFDFVNNVDVSTLGMTGLGALLYTVLAMMKQIEAAFNHTWRVRQSRSLGQQLRDYLGLIMVGPVLIFFALGVSAAIWHSPPLQMVSSNNRVEWLVAVFIEYLPRLLIVFAFMWLYWFLPNTRVRFKAAISGALVAGLSWHFAGWVFARFVVESGQQAIIYTVFASLFFFILWLYVGWLILLTGSSIAYYIQYPNALFYQQDRLKPLSPQQQFVLLNDCVEAMHRRFAAGEPPATLDELCQAVAVPPGVLEPALNLLIRHDYVICQGSEPARYLLTRQPDALAQDHLRELIWQSGLSA